VCVFNQSFDDFLTISRFRWVALQLDTVSRCRSLNALRGVLFSLPHSLDETYSRILESIDAAEQPHVRRILQWLCFSKRPLCIEEIALVYEVGDKIQPAFASDDDIFHLEDIVDICRGLLSLSVPQADWGSPKLRWDDKQGSFSQPYAVQIPQLAHFSVKEYLLSPRSGSWVVDQMSAEVTIMKSAITCYLHFLTLDATHLVAPIRALPEEQKQYSLAQYFVQYFSDHLASVMEHLDLLPSLKLLLHPSNTPFHYKVGWCLISPYDSYPVRRSKDPALNLRFAAHFGLTQICQYLFEMNIYPDLARPANWSPQTVSCTPLTEAARCGNVEMMQVLLNARTNHQYSGADPLEDGWALEEAAIQGDVRITQMLLEAGDNATSQFSGPLLLATRHGHKENVIALVAAGADVDAQNGRAIQLASFAGNEWMVQVLIEAGASVNLKDEMGKTALQVALDLGYTKIVQMLITAGAEVHEALRCALASGQERAIRVLIEAGVDVNLIVKSTGETALQITSRSGYSKIVQMLIAAGAGVDDKALHYALAGGHEETVLVLIEAGADVNLIGKSTGETALQIASRSGYSKTVQALIAAGADVDAGNGRALRYALAGRHEGIIRTLIEGGADVNLKGMGETALEAASRLGYTNIVQMLVAAGADVNAGKGRALQYALAGGHEGVIRVLVDAGAEKETK
jgi:ankyrin repeat protein